MRRPQSSSNDPVFDVQGRAGKGHLRKVTVACVVTNVLVWFHFGACAFLAPQIGARPVPAS